MAGTAAERQADAARARRHGGAMAAPARRAANAGDRRWSGGAAAAGAGAGAARQQAGTARRRSGAVQQGGIVGERLTGKLSFIDNAVDTATGTVQLKATFDNANGRLWAGPVRDDVAASLRSRRTRSSCRTQAIVTGQRGTYVYVVDQADTARQRARGRRAHGGRLRDHRERHSRRRSRRDGRAVAPHAGCAGAHPRRDDPGGGGRRRRGVAARCRGGARRRSGAVAAAVAAAAAASS